MKRNIVSELLADEQTCVVSQTTTVRHAAEQLMLSGCELLAVTDDTGRLSGVVTESSVVRSLLNPAPDTGDLRGIVSRHIESIRADAPLDHVLHLFRSSCYSAVPVIDAHERVCGLLRRRDVMQYLLNGRIDGSHAATQPSHRLTSADRPTNSPASAEQRSPEVDACDPVSRPHFLRGEAARRLLQRDEDASAS